MKIAAELMSDPQTEENQIERQRAFKTSKDYVTRLSSQWTIG